MRNTWLLLGLLLLHAFSANAQKKIVVMGSSTAAGTGASHPDSSWVGRLQKIYRQNTADGIDTIVYNLAGYGQTTYHQMPTGWVSPISNRPAVDPEHNVTKALSFFPDIVIINLPSNDVAHFYWEGNIPLYSPKETMDNFRYMKQVLNNNGIKTFITTTQPRNDMDFTKRQMQAQLLDSIRNNFRWAAINFWDPIVSIDGQYLIKPELKTDEVHVNDQGHRLLFQQVLSANIFSTPYQPIPSKIEAEDYAAMSGIQLENTTEPEGGSNIGYVDQGDWMDYNINVRSAQSFNLNFRVASIYSNGQFQVRNAAGNVLATVNVPNTGGWQTWQTVKASVSLPAGNQTIRIICSGSDHWNMNWMDFSAVVTTLFLSNYKSIPSKIEAEDYSSMSGVQTEMTSDLGGGKNVGYIDPNDWMDYNIYSPSSQAYTVKFRVATPQFNARFEIRNSQGVVLAVANVPNTGDYQSWQTITATVTLPSGNQRIRIISTGSGFWNINWFEFISNTVPGYVTVPARIQAEQWSAMSGVQKESTSDAGGGENVGYIDNGDWMDYNINVPVAKNYTLSFRLATPNGNAQFQVLKGNNLLSTVNINPTGGYQSWNTQSISVPLSAGTQTIRLLSSGGGAWNINWLEFSETTVSGGASALFHPEESVTEAKTGFNVYPNPFRDQLTLTVSNAYTGNMNLKVISPYGMVHQVFRLTKRTAGAESFSLSMDRLPRGSYVLVLESREGTTSKIIVRE